MSLRIGDPFSDLLAASHPTPNHLGTGNGGAGVSGPVGTPRCAGIGGRRDGAGLIQPGWRLGPLDGGAGGPGGLPAVAHPVPRQGSWAAPGLTSLGHEAPTQASGMTRAEGGGWGTAAAPPCAAAGPQQATSSAAAQSGFMTACPAPEPPLRAAWRRGWARVAPGPERARDGSSVLPRLAACPGRPGLNPAGCRRFSPPRPSAPVRC